MEITKNEAIDILKNIFGIENFEEKFKKSKLELLNEFIKSFYHCMPYQSITHVSKEMKERKTPTIKDTMTYIRTKQGGTCLSLNIAMYSILNALGYRCYLVMSFVVCDDDHVIPILEELDDDENSKYVVEVGAAYPTFEAVKLVMNGESKICPHNTLPCKYKQMDNGEFHRLHKKINKQTGEIEWKTFYTFKLEPKVTPSMAETLIGKTVYENIENPFNIAPRMIVFLNERMIALKNDQLSIEMEDGTVQFNTYDEDEELFAQLYKYFPNVNKEEIISAFSLWRKAGSPKI